MAARANSLTERVTAVPAGAGARPTSPASDLRAFVEALRRLGYQTDSLLTAAGLREFDLDDPDARVSCDALVALVAGAQQQRFTPNLGIELARVTPIGAYPLLDYLVLTSDTVGDGTRQLARYFRLVGSPVAIDVYDDSDPIRIEMPGTAAPFGIEYNVALLALHFRAETGGCFSIAHVSFTHTPDDVPTVERLLGCPVQANAPRNRVSVALDAWRLPLRRRDPVLRRVLESQADEILARLPAKSGFALEVQRAIASRVAGGDTRLAAVARHLTMSGRTMQRRLAGEGVSFQTLLDEARREAAGRQLSESTLAIGEVAYLVGYSEPAPFYRAFKRWYGTTPEVFRKSRRNHRR